MNWLGRLLKKPAPVQQTSITKQPGPRSPETLPVMPAEKILIDNIGAWAARLEREGRRTGNLRMIRQAETIRAKHRLK